MRTPIIMADPQTTTEVWGWVRQHLLAQKPAEDSLHMLRNAHERAAIFEGGMRMMERLVVPCEEQRDKTICPPCDGNEFVTRATALLQSFCMGGRPIEGAERLLREFGKPPVVPSGVPRQADPNRPRPECPMGSQPCHNPLCAVRCNMLDDVPSTVDNEPVPEHGGPAATLALYNELLYTVGKKYPGETRHQTALRYLKRAEESVDDRPGMSPKRQKL